MNLELEHRIYSQMPPQAEHNTASEHCWCKPRVKVMDNGNKIIVHNDISEFFETKPKKEGH